LDDNYGGYIPNNKEKKMKTYMTDKDLIDLYYDMSKKKLLRKNGSAYRRWEELRSRQQIKEIYASKHTSKNIKKFLADQIRVAS
jgi:hypothetical protein